MNVTVAQVWTCPNCGLEHRSDRVLPNRFHVCPRLRYLTAPMVLAGTAAKVELVERGDYIGRELVQLDPERGRPVQSIVTTRDNGQDCVVLAPTATMKGSI
jgi:hypothetical protein